MADLPSRDALDSFLLRFVQDVRHSERIDPLPEYLDDFLMLFGLIQRVRRLTQAYLRLRRHGFSSEAEVLVRAAMEHAITAQYSYLTSGGIARLTVTLANAQRRYAEAIAEGTTRLDIHAWADSFAVPEGPALPHFSGNGMMGELDRVKFLKTTYKVLSQTGHVSHESQIDAIIQVDGEFRLNQTPDSSLEHEVLYALTGFCLLSDWILARLEGNENEIRRLEQYGHLLSLPWRLDFHLPSEKRRFPDEDK